MRLRSAACRRSPGGSSSGAAGTCSRSARASTAASRCRPRTARTAGVGNLRSTCEKSRSVAACIVFSGVSVIMMSIGAPSAIGQRGRRRADVQADDHALVLARGEERVPVVAEDVGPAELDRVLGERDRVAALRGDAVHLVGHELRVPDGRDRQRDEAARVRAAPLVDVPVVVGPQHVEAHVEVLRAAEQLAAELHEAREAHRAEQAVAVHVVDPLVDVVAAVADHVVAGRLDVVLLGRPPGDGVEPDVGDLAALVDPDVDAVVLVHALGRELLPLLGKVVVEQGRGLDDVVVDAHQDQILGLRHGEPPGLRRLGFPDVDVRVPRR